MAYSYLYSELEAPVIPVGLTGENVTSLCLSWFGHATFKKCWSFTLVVFAAICTCSKYYSVDYLVARTS